jgi:hypothetical protein
LDLFRLDRWPDSVAVPDFGPADSGSDCSGSDSSVVADLSGMNRRHLAGSAVTFDSSNRFSFLETAAPSAAIPGR